jgi:beta-glucosidase
MLAEYETEGLAPTILPGDLDRMSPPLDFLGINHYSSHKVSASGGVESGGFPLTDLGWPVHAAGLHDMLLHMTKLYGRRPIYITKNGAFYRDLVTADGQVHDPKRADYLRGYIGAMHRAIQDGADVRGYFVWTLMDNFEWARGYDVRFGLAHTDYPKRRTIKDSGRFFARVCAENGLEER